MRTYRTSTKLLLLGTVSTIAAATLTSCSSDSYEYESDSPALTKFRSSQPAYETVREPKNLQCETNIIEAQRHDYSGNTIIDTEDVEIAVVAANFEKGDESGDSDRLAFWITPDTPHKPAGDLDSDYWVEMHVETESGRVFRYSFTESDDYSAEVDVDGNTSDASDDVSFTSGGSSGFDYYPVPPGFAKPSDPLKFVTIKYNGKALARCTPAEGSAGIAEADYTVPTSGLGSSASTTSSDPMYTEYANALTSAGVDFRPGTDGAYASDQSTCSRLSEGTMDSFQLATNERVAHSDTDSNGRRVEIMVPILCPENQPLVDEAKTGNAVQQNLLDGNFIVAQMREPNSPMVVQPGVWRTKQSPVSDCYYERSDGAGNIIENNFVNFAQSLTVTIAPSDGAFVSTRCGGWERVS